MKVNYTEYNIIKVIHIITCKMCGNREKIEQQLIYEI